MKRDTLDEIYKSYMDEVYRYLLFLCRNHYLAEDVMQETFYRAYLHLEDCPEERVKPWLFRVAHNAFVDIQRKDTRNYTKAHDYFERLTDGVSAEDEAIKKEGLTELTTIICNLPGKQQEAILLYDFHGFSYDQSAEIMDVKVGYFKVLLFRARQKIRQERGV
ncbi:sigma-70 family RNA polymerase sigma factor [Dethiobacter alkaliphilus]|uniref:RNA polymerase, sigma-24 subunit, ECF subfamily n=1 Tax=Dethiobacter alkaliphilus AHT 1 TaxID=555088 RepID=C0GD66_DETAL|nr:sigma-70 family RNA polymerase sigma factor [Dethiobacter alkaliphilus]EEG78587.1 RNA polymerase, sigma-24 subunit, ECF subfamily [Dethiobacter alkaliphilus AHT 1]